MKNITYLLGAGASAQKLPVVSEMPTRIRKTIAKLKVRQGNASYTPLKRSPIPNEGSLKSLYGDLIDALEWLAYACDAHASIDTFAKKLTITGQYSVLRKLKITTSAYFALEQELRGFDNRYGAFFASVISASGSFPERLRILSWNYDNQLEMAYSGFNNGLDSVSDNALGLRMKTKFSRPRSTTGFCVVKLNGQCGFQEANGLTQYNFVDNITNGSDLDSIDTVLLNYGIATYGLNVYPTLSFASEEEKNTQIRIVDTAVAETKDTNILVVIGYTFPFFNREIDRAILDSMPNLEKVYYQDPYASKLINRIQAVKSETNNLEIIPYEDKDQFFLPYEL